MKKITLLCIAAGLYACDTSEEPRDTNDNSTGATLPWYYTKPAFEIKDSEGNNLFENGTYKLDELSISATDENWNIMYFPNGTPITVPKDMLELTKYINEQTEPHM